MSEKYSPTPEDRPEPESLRTSNDDFLSQLEEKLEVPLSPDELRAAAQARHDQEKLQTDMADDSKPPDGETFEQTLGNFEGKMASEVMETQWEKLDPVSQHIDGLVHRLRRDIILLVHKLKPSDTLARVGPETGDVWLKFSSARESFLTGQTGPLEYQAILTETEQRLRHLKNQLLSKK